MTVDVPFLIRAGEVVVSPSGDDIQEIRSAVEAAIEVLESLIRIAADDRTSAALMSEGNGEAHGPSPRDVQEISQRLHDGLSALTKREMDVEAIESVASDLDQFASSMKEGFVT